MTVYFHEEDLPDGVLAGTSALAVDTETMGLITHRDRLCLVQISDGSGDEHLVRFAPGSTYEAPNLSAILADESRVKLYHYARFDLAAIQYYLGVVAAPVLVWVIASGLARFGHAVVMTRIMLPYIDCAEAVRAFRVVVRG